MRYLFLITLFLCSCSSEPVARAPKSCVPFAIDREGHVADHGQNCKKR